jgi:hypothetical protein
MENPSRLVTTSPQRKEGDIINNTREYKTFSPIERVGLEEIEEDKETLLIREE